MPLASQRTFSPRPQDISREWYVVDADGQTLGRLAARVAAILRGKHKPIFAPHMDTGDHVVIVNAAKVRLTGNKLEQKRYYRHSGYPGGLKTVPYTVLLSERPSRAVERAVRGMLPHNRLGRQMIRKLKVYDGPTHPHAAQRPKAGGIQRQWHLIDASDVVLGRLASQVAILLRGKHKPIFAPHMDTGDFVVVVNADKVALSGSKLQDKRAYRHSGYPGGIHSVTYSELLAKHPERVVEKAVKGMLPKNSLGRNMLRKLKVYAGPDHPHQAQQPVPFTIKQIAQQAGSPADAR